MEKEVENRLEQTVIENGFKNTKQNSDNLIHENGYLSLML